MGKSSAAIPRRVLSWLIIAQGTLLGMFIVAVLGARQEPPGIVVVTLTVGIASILGSFLATRNPRKAARIALSVSPFAILLIPRFHLGLAVPVLVLAGATLIPGLFWLFTSSRNWPLALQNPLFPHRPRLATLLGTGLFAVVILASVLISLSLPWWPLIGDCGTGPLLNEQGSPQNVDFTAKILFVGPVSYEGWSLWAVARIEERFSDAPRSIFGLVILRQFFRPTDKFEWFFVEGGRSQGTLTSFLPVIERVECGHSKRLTFATVELTVLRDGPPPIGVRIIGRVYTDRANYKAPSTGTEVLITGPAGQKVVVTDNRGIFDVTGLPPGEYSVELREEATRSVYRLDLRKVAVENITLFLDETRKPYD
jgi:hypothetical protein